MSLLVKDHIELLNKRVTEAQWAELADFTAAQLAALNNLTTAQIAAMEALSAAELAFIDGVTAGTAAASKALVLDANKGVAHFRDLSAPRLVSQGAPAAKTTTTTLTAAELIGGLLTGNPGGAAAATYTTPTGTDMETALIAVYPGLQNNDAFDFTIINLSTDAAEDITVAAGAGFTAVGNMVVESNEATAQKSPFGTFRVRRTGANAYSIYRVA